MRSELTTLEHDLTATSDLFQRLIQQSTPLQQEWQQAEKKLAELKMTLEQKQSLFQQNTATLSQLEQQKAQTKERLQLIELQLESLVDQQENQQDKSTAARSFGAAAEPAISGFKSTATNPSCTICASQSASRTATTKACAHAGAK